MNLPNKLTMFRVILIPFFVAFLLLRDMDPSFRWIALGIFIVASLTDLLDTAAAAGKRPRLYVACGTEGPLLDQNRRFCVMARERAFPLIREEWAGGHTWAFWDRACGRSFAFMAGMDPDKVLEEA